MVKWLSPAQLAGTALQVVLSQIFGAYSDKREIQACLPPGDRMSYADHPELWFDYVADSGDAFDPTYSIASLLARPDLEVAPAGGDAHATRRGRLLVMGGDQAYPTASVEAYENKLIGPYRAALPYCDADSPDLYVLPGNHDWYDGLTAFMRVFCRRQWVGGWKTHQSRSYWAMQLPHGWWLWGIDIQFDSYIDEPQFHYFDEAAKKMAEGDSVILCSPMPSWVRAHDSERPEAYVTLDYLERKLIRRQRAVVRLGLTGDHHHYARYATADGTRHKITAGGGGAFLSETHHLPDEIVLPPPASKDPGKTTPPHSYRLATAYPDKAISRRLRWRVAELPFLNVSFWALISGVYLAFAWMTQAAASARIGGNFGTVMENVSYVDMLKALGRSPLALLVALALSGGLIGFTKAKEPAKKYGLGVAHALAHLVLIVLVIGTSTAIVSATGWSGAAFVVVYVLLVGVVGGLLGSWLMAAYLIVADRFGLNSNELFAAQRNRDYKCFVRLHIDRDGGLTVYPIGVDRTCRRWRLRAGGTGNDPWFEAVDGPLRPRLIEDPIRIGPG
jgi:3',5'-cyclic AMP phosphodiesterase CpdA